MTANCQHHPHYEFCEDTHPFWLVALAKEAIASHVQDHECEDPCRFFVGYWRSWIARNPKWNEKFEQAFYELCGEKR